MTNQITITGLPDENTIARRYTQALFGIAEEKSLEQEFLSQLTDISTVLSADTDRLGKLMLVGRLPLNQQKELLQEVFAQQIHPLLLNLLFLLLDKGRGGYLPALLPAYQRLLDEKFRVLPVTVVCPYAMAAEQEASLAVAITKLCGKQIRLNQVVDNTLIGGLKLIIDGKVYDGSLQRQLEKLETNLKYN